MNTPHVASVDLPEAELVASLRDFSKGMFCSHEQSLVIEAAANVIEAYGMRLSDGASGRWIPCAERMPDIGRMVLVDGGVAQFRRSAAQEVEWMSLTGFAWPGSRIQWEVTHWMPLPEAPK